MGKRHSCIWVVMFALLANAADASSIWAAGSGGLDLFRATICDAQLLIASIGAPESDEGPANTICHLQQALGGATGGASPAAPDTHEALHAVFLTHRVTIAAGNAPLPIPISHFTALVLEFPETPAAHAAELAAPCLAPASRYLYLLTPHAPPAFA